MVEIESILSYTLQAMVPYILASMGIIIAGRAGVFDITAEGLMLLSASITFLTVYSTGGNLFLGILVSIVVGTLTGLLLWYLTTYRKIDQFVAGLLLIVVYTGVAGLLYKLLIGITLLPPSIPTLKPIVAWAQLPPWISFLNQNPIFYTSIILVILMDYIIFKSGWGLSFRAVGENPRAADVSGIDVYTIRLISLILGNILVSLAGAYVVATFTGTYTDTIISGRGWISIGIVIFSGWRIIYTLVGSTIMASLETAIYILQSQRSPIQYQILQMIPFIAMLAVLIIISKKAMFPRALGRNYDREAYEEY